MPRGKVPYETLYEGSAKPKLPSLFGRGRRESILAMLAVAGPLYWHEIQRSAGVAEGHAFRRELGPLLDAELVVMSMRPGQRRSVSLNTMHPWYSAFRGLGRALSRIDMPRVLVARNAKRPESLGRTVVPTRENVEALFGSESRTRLLLALHERADSPQFISERTGISEAHVIELMKALKTSGIARYLASTRFACLDRRWPAYRAMSRFLHKLADVFETGHPPWSVPVVIGSEIRTKLIALLAANGPSRYKDLCPVLRTAPSYVYAAALRLIGIGVVRTMRDADGDQKLSFYALDPAYPAHDEIQALGCAIAERNGAPSWCERGTFVPRPYPTCKRHARGWLFKRNRKTTLLLLMHAAGAADYNSIATALAITHKQASFITAHLVRDGLLSLTRKGRFVTVRPNADNPYHRELSALVQKLLRAKYPEVVGLARALPFASKPKSLNG